MITVRGTQTARTCDGVRRRDVLKAGALSLFGGTLLTDGTSHAARPTGKIKSVILIDLFGGPSHIDTFDPKPDAPAEARGEFGTIPTILPGVRVCEHLPTLAKRLDRCSLIRTLSHGYNSHNPYAVMTGFTGGNDRENYFAKPSDHPGMGSVCLYSGLGKPGVPGYVCLPAYPGYSQGLRRSGPYGGYLGGQYNPMFATCEVTLPGEYNENTDFFRHDLTPMGEPQLPSLQAQFGVDVLDRRRTLLGQLDVQAARLEESVKSVAVMGQRQQQAFDFLTSGAARTAFDLSREPSAIRDRYGRDIFGSSTLLARRLVEAGVTFTTVHTEAKGTGHWDTHQNNFRMLKSYLLPFLDRAVSALIDDLEARGLWETTLVLVMGDMGRTPRVNPNAGRDHWPQCGFCLLFGGGIKRGHVHGTTDKTAAFPVDLPVSPGDICATVYHLLGIDPEMTVLDLTARPIHVSHGGRPISGVLC